MQNKLWIISNYRRTSRFKTSVLLQTNICAYNRKKFEWHTWTHTCTHHTYVRPCSRAHTVVLMHAQRTHTNTYLNTPSHTHTLTCIYTHMQTRTHLCAHTHTHVNIHTHTHIRAHTQICFTQTHSHMHIHTNMRAHTHIHSITHADVPRISVHACT